MLLCLYYRLYGIDSYQATVTECVTKWSADKSK